MAIGLRLGLGLRRPGFFARIYVLSSEGGYLTTDSGFYRASA